jgi:hypothetical protein
VPTANPIRACLEVGKEATDCMDKITMGQLKLRMGEKNIINIQLIEKQV